MGGRLTHFLQNWQALGPNYFVQEVIQSGHTLPFAGNSPTFRGVLSTPLSGPYKKVLLNEVESLLKKNAVEVVPKDQCQTGWYGRYFLVPKKTGDLRPILNLKPLNKHLLVESFKMESLRNVILACRPGEWLASVDLKDAYFHVPIHKQHRKFLRFALRGVCYQYRVLPFGLATSPRVFTKVLAPVVAAIRCQGIHIHPYLDDLLIRASSPRQLSIAVTVVLDQLGQAGFLINKAKSETVPSQDLNFIGGRFRPDLGAVYLPEERRLVLQKVVHSFMVGSYRPAKAWLGLLGLMAATIYVVRFARLNMRAVQIYLKSRWNQDKDSVYSQILVPFSLAPTLRWWANPVNLLTGLPLSPPTHNHVVTTDASGSGWGGVLNDSQSIQGVWQGKQKKWHINRQELMAAELTIRHFASLLRNSTVLVRSDNTTTCAYINKEGGTKSHDLCGQVVRLLLWCQSQRICLRAIYIPGVDNVHADDLSRKGHLTHREISYQLDHREWALNQEVANAIFVVMDQPQIDLFATRANAKTPVFCALQKGQGEVSTDAMSTLWSHTLGYAYPPTGLITRVLSKVIQEQAQLILIAPLWKDRPWYSTLLTLLVRPPLKLPDRQDLLIQAGQFHRYAGNLQLTAWRISGNVSDGREFRRRLWESQSKRGLQAQSPLTKLNGEYLSAGAVQGILIPLLFM